MLARAIREASGDQEGPVSRQPHFPSRWAPRPSARATNTATSVLEGSRGRRSKATQRPFGDQTGGPSQNRLPVTRLVLPVSTVTTSMKFERTLRRLELTNASQLPAGDQARP